MSRYTVICHRCGKPTFVDLSKTISDQRCRVCRGFLQGVDVSIGDRRAETHRKLVVRVAGAAGREPEWLDGEVPVVPIRQRWPRFFSRVVWCTVIVFAATMAKVMWDRWAASSRGETAPLLQQEEPVKVDVRLTEAWRVAATDLAKKALAATTVSELLPLLYHPEVDADVIRSYYGSEEKLPLGTDLIEDYYIPSGNYTENVVAFNFTDSAKRPRGFALIERKDGMKIDWPSLVGLGEMSVKDYVTQAPQGVVVMRARARLGQYYNDYFSDSKRWISVRLSDVTDDNVFHAYFDRLLPGSDEITALPDPEGKVPRPDSPVIVVLKHPKGNLASDQTQITSLIATTWYLQDGLKPYIEQARKLDEVREGTAQGTEKSSPPPDPVPAPQTPVAPPP